MARIPSPTARPVRLMVLTAAWTFVLDQATKLLVVQWLDLAARQRIDVWPPFVNFRMAWNEGVNFGLFAGFDMRWVLVAVALLISAAVALWVRREGGGRLTHVSAGLLIGGALGNVVDRVVYGAVADFLNVSCCGVENPYAFNVADIAVFLGAAGLVLFAGRGGAPRGRPARVPPKPPARPLAAKPRGRPGPPPKPGDGG